MSSFPTHESNIEALGEMGYDVSEYLDDDGSVSLESWGYDELTYLLDDLIGVMLRKGFNLKENDGDDE